ncbi:hypothetical protein KAK06_06570 [Ideonella sp. 4Y11]|uniref:Uncharacterized protein n=1 Tax=Ideonella aquatica TaxID=2824119 RepID=A0A941BQ11_9BURK|nr:hypothetical protein [Ideonella aquatica]MBQ0958620.1 hypothetical protein [Ideonella aquatica]
MLQAFSTPEALWAAFVVRAQVLLLGCVLLSVVVWVAGRRSELRWSVGEAALVGVLVLAGGLWIFKTSTLDRFWQLEASPSGVRLAYRHEVLAWPAAEVLQVQYGFRSKTLHGPCHLALHTADGRRHVSAEMRLSLQACKDLRAEVMAALGR